MDARSIFSDVLTGVTVVGAQRPLSLLSPHVWYSVFPKIFACGNLESGIQEILIAESGILLTIRNENQVLLTKTGIKCLESEIHGVESRIQDCLGFSYTQGAKKVIF